MTATSGTEAGFPVRLSRSTSRLLAIVATVALAAGSMPAALLAASPIPTPTAAATGADWPQFGHDAAHTGYNPDETTISAANVADLKVAWTTTFGDDPRDSAQPPVVADGVIYVGTGEGRGLYAFPVDCASGGRKCTPLWTARTDGWMESSPTVADGVVYVGTTHGLVAYAADCASDGGTCSPLWTAPQAFSAASPTVADGVVYVGSDATQYGDPKLYAYAAGCASGGGTCSPLWTAPGMGAPAVANGVVYVASGDGRLYAYAVGCASGGATCSPLWTSTPGVMLSAPAVANGVVYAHSYDGNLFAYAAGCASGGGTCRPLWSAPGLGSPAVANGVVYVGGAGGNMYAYAADCASDGGTCSPLWTATDVSVAGAPVVSNGVVYAVSLEGRLSAYTVGCATAGATCKPIWTSVADAGGLPVIANGVVYFVFGGSSGVTLRALALATTTPSASPSAGTPAPATHMAPPPSRAPVAPGSGNWPQFGHDAAHTGFNPAETTISTANVAQLKLAWTGARAGNTESPPVVADGVVYTFPPNGKLYAYSADCGNKGGACKPLWAANVGAYGGGEAPAVADGVIYVIGATLSTGRKIYAFAVGCGRAGRTCKPIWTGDIGDAGVVDTPLVVANGVVYEAAGNTLYAFAVGCATGGATCTPLWTADVSGGWSAPAVADGVLYVRSGDGMLRAYAVGCASGGEICAPLWTAAVGTPAGGGAGTPTVADGVVYVNGYFGYGGRLYAFPVGCASGGATCQPLWMAATADAVGDSPAVANGVVFVPSGMEFFAFAVGCASDGGRCTPLWTATPGARISAPTVANGVVYMNGNDGKLRAYAADCASNGGACSPLWSTKAGGLWISPVVANGVVYVYGDTLSAYSLPASVSPTAASPTSGNKSTTSGGLYLSLLVALIVVAGLVLAVGVAAAVLILRRTRGPLAGSSDSPPRDEGSTPDGGRGQSSP
jgi:outer membrane protein assembly factor BamB